MMTLDEAVSSLNKVILPWEPFYKWYFKYHGKYMGTVSSKEFEIKRVILYYGNAFRPMIYGEFERTSSNLKIHIKMKMFKWVIVF